MSVTNPTCQETMFETNFMCLRLTLEEKKKYIYIYFFREENKIYIYIYILDFGQSGVIVLYYMVPKVPQVFSFCMYILFPAELTPITNSLVWKTSPSPSALVRYLSSLVISVSTKAGGGRLSHD